VQISPSERESLVIAERNVREQLERLTNSGVVPRMKVVSIDEQGAGNDTDVPRRLREAYALLHHAAYGTDPAVSTGDPSVIRGLGRRGRARTSTNQETEIPGARTNQKRPGANRRNIIKDRRAYEWKLRADRRMRRLAAEIEGFLSSSDPDAKVNQCSRCGRIGEDGWSYCPACGHPMELVERTTEVG
jgi:hypothetical protein